MREPDVTDPDVRQMVLDNHRPDETWLVGGLLVGIHCKACTRTWPCPAILAARKQETAIRGTEWEL